MSNTPEIRPLWWETVNETVDNYAPTHLALLTAVEFLEHCLEAFQHRTDGHPTAYPNMAEQNLAIDAWNEQRDQLAAPPESWTI